MTRDEMLERAKNFLKGRSYAYRATFSLESPTALIVLKDLAVFCRANKSTFHVEPNMAARLDGRREVFLRLQQHLQLNDDQLWQLLGDRT